MEEKMRRIEKERFRGRRLRNLVIEGVVGIEKRRKDGKEMGVDIVMYKRIEIVGNGIKEEEFILRVIEEKRNKKIEIVGEEDGNVIGDELREKWWGKKEKENKKRKVKEKVGIEIMKEEIVERREKWKF